MKNLTITVLIVTGLAAVSCQSPKNPANNNTIAATTQTNLKAKRVEVLDFHTAHRCETCIAIEENTRYTLDKYFADELEDGTITFALINADDEQNIALVEKYMAYGTSLFINVVDEGQEHYSDISRFAFLKGTNRDEFSKDLKQKLDSALVTL